MRILFLPVIGATAFFTLLLIYTKLVGPIPFSVTSVTTQKSDTFQVSGEGKTLAVPDIAFVDVGVFASGNTVKEVKDQIDSTIDKVLTAVKTLGIEPKDIQTTRYDISPNYDVKPGRQSITGYQANVNLSIRVSNIDQINSVIDLATQNGANQVWGIKFDISDRTKAENEAREKAVAEAKKKAEQAAEAAGFRLGKIVNYHENLQGDIIPSPVSLSSVQEVREVTAPNIEPGSTEISVTVTLSYEIL